MLFSLTLRYVTELEPPDGNDPSLIPYQGIVLPLSLKRHLKLELVEGFEPTKELTSKPAYKAGPLHNSGHTSIL